MFYGNSSILLFNDGPGGTGKTFTKCYYKYFNSTNISYKCFAFTGIAASLLKGGKTLNLIFLILLILNSTKLFSFIIIRSKGYNDLVETKVF